MNIYILKAMAASAIIIYIQRDSAGRRLKFRRKHKFLIHLEHPQARSENRLSESQCNQSYFNS
jgi:hypothetical protein